MNKRAIIITISALFIAIIVYYSPITSANTEKVTIIGEIVNVREQPGTTYSIVTQIHKGETYSLVDSENGWYKIKLPSNQTGWIAGWLAEGPTKSETLSEPFMATVQTNSLNVRSQPDPTSERIGVLNEGDQVKITGEQNGWSQIEYESEIAWVSSDYISKVDAVTTASSQTNQISILYDGTNIRKKPALKSQIVTQVSSGETFSVLEKNGDWYKIEYASGKTGFVASWIVAATTSQTDKLQFKHKPGAKMVVIDPGHGGRDQGATGSNGTLEKNLTLEIGNLLAHKLDKAGFNVVLTRSTDEYISLESRTEQANVEQADAFISLHYDSIDNQQVEGHTSYYYNEQDRILAETIHNNITEAVQLRDRGVRFGDYYVLRENTRPSILLELGYLSNPQEEQTVKSKTFREQTANAIVDGIKEYFEN
ncbi:N-acetylmuramoyl-L-alanine amidase [Lederbergia sp. NSJ-179]|uniref:N-acetylmuramoyl-L-alanine amidase n=1 Tax=Lederbergia sp. NSJ-179 TaxID=2931402 RepID=UPI001FD4A534|nr:N-acetylmuramoyl-L-alanine amidase [Lederbergia sp. NSJ-179]MCJ7839932.1 N-acetylmuramoyl-L-alanine amidase [Lederbergia sp. NSJ-179]